MSVNFRALLVGGGPCIMDIICVCLKSIQVELAMFVKYV